MSMSIREMFRKFCMETSILGLKYFYIYPDTFSRCFWSITMLSITSAACMLTWLLYERFGEIPTRVTIENQYEPLLNVPYPAITICTPNKIAISSVNHFNRTLVDGNVTVDLEQVLPRLMAFYTPMRLPQDDSLVHLQSLIDINRYTVTDVMHLLPQNCEDFLRMCLFRGRVFPHCRGLLRPILTSHGLCCIFNSVYYFKDGKRNEKDPNFVSHKVTSSVYSEGLTVITDYNPEDALDRTVMNAGAVRVMINDVGEFPSNDEMSMVNPDSESFHVLHATYTYCSEDVQQLPSWSRKCYFKDEYVLPFVGDYHNSDCDMLCYVRAVESACNCQLFFVPYVKATRACNVTSAGCVRKVRQHIYQYITPEECECPRDCNHRHYQADNLIGNLKALPYVLNKPYSSLVFNKSTSMMHFYFTNPVYVKQKQETVMSLITLASNLGGVFGMCLGCSAISIMEILFFIYLVIRKYIRDRLKRPGYPVVN